MIINDKSPISADFDFYKKMHLQFNNTLQKNSFHAKKSVNSEPSEFGEFMTKIFNRNEELEKPRELRNNSTKAESLLWQQLKGKQVAGFKFRRQYSVGKFVLDFYCAERKLAIELDGSSHDGEDAQT